MLHVYTHSAKLPAGIAFHLRIDMTRQYSTEGREVLLLATGGVLGLAPSRLPALAGSTREGIEMENS